MLPPQPTWPYLTALVGASLCVAAILVIALCLSRKEKRSATSPSDPGKVKPKTTTGETPKQTATSAASPKESPYAAAVLLTQLSEGKEDSGDQTTQDDDARDQLSALDSANSSRQSTVANSRPSLEETATTASGSNRPPSGSNSTPTPSPSPRQTISGEEASAEEPVGSSSGRPSAETAPSDTEPTDLSEFRISTGNSAAPSMGGSANNTDQAAARESQSEPPSAHPPPLIVISPPDSSDPSARSANSESAAPVQPHGAHLVPPPEVPGGGGILSPALSPSLPAHLDRNSTSTASSRPLVVFRPEWMIDYSDIEFKRKIGSGSFGTVFLGTYEGEECAIKQASFTVEEDALENFKREAALILSIKPHPAIVQVLGISSNDTDLYVIMEYCDRGSLDKLVQKVKIDNVSKLRLLQSAAAGIAHLHRERIVHRDIAARNILVSSPLRAKVADFGMSRIVGQFDDKGVTASNIGPIRWMSPESIGKREYSTASDVWMFGILCTEVWNEKPPHHNMDNFEVAMKIRYEGYHPDLPADMPEWLKEICLQCWSLDPAKRPTMTSIIAKFKAEVKLVEDPDK